MCVCDNIRRSIVCPHPFSHSLLCANTLTFAYVPTANLSHMSLHNVISMSAVDLCAYELVAM